LVFGLLFPWAAGLASAEMKFIGEHYKPGLVIIPIGGHFVMSPEDAAYTTSQWIKPKYALPVRHGTFPQLLGTTEEYMQALGNAPT
jgi:L-ascorbate metabolism protein UlaG (beta-lactamase superfamily)